jgi:hypothetical protein
MTERELKEYCKRELASIVKPPNKNVSDSIKRGFDAHYNVKSPIITGKKKSRN